jgi:hypothetical protein
MELRDTGRCDLHQLATFLLLAVQIVQEFNSFHARPMSCVTLVAFLVEEVHVSS